MESHFEGLRLGVGRRHSCGETLVVEWSTDYGDGRVYRNVTVAELQDGHAVRLTDYSGRALRATRVAGAAGGELEMPSEGVWPAVGELRGDEDTQEA